MGNKWDESRAQSELPCPPLNLRWRRYPEKQPDYSKSFQPSAANLPVGNTGLPKSRFVKQWTDIFLPVMEQVGSFTNEHARETYGYLWRDIGFVDMLKFTAIVIRMSIVRRNRMDMYFDKKMETPSFWQ